MTMSSQGFQESCFLCALPTTTPTHDDNDEGHLDDPDTPVLLKKQLEIYFLVTSLVKLPPEECVDLVSTYGNPKDWMSLCPSCHGLLREAYNINEQIRTLAKKMETLSKELLRPFFLVKTEDEGIYVIPENIRQGGYNNMAEVRIRQFAHKVKNRNNPGVWGTFNGGDEDESLCEEKCSSDSEFMIIPDWLRRSDRRKRASSKNSCLVGGKKIKKERGHDVEPINLTSEGGKNYIDGHNRKEDCAKPMTLEQIQSLSGPQLLEKLFDGKYYTCPMPSCPTHRGYTSKKSFLDHARHCHPHFLAHLQRGDTQDPFPHDHECHGDQCFPSLLANPLAFQQKQKDLYYKNTNDDTDNDASQCKSQHNETNENVNHHDYDPTTIIIKPGFHDGCVADDDDDHFSFTGELAVDQCSNSGTEEEEGPNNNQEDDDGWDFEKDEETLSVDEITRLTGSDLLGKLFNGSHYTCPMSTCRSRKGCGSEKGLKRHVRDNHPSFSAHLHSTIPPEHECRVEDGFCLPSLLLKPAAFARKQDKVSVLGKKKTKRRQRPKPKTHKPNVVLPKPKENVVANPQGTKKKKSGKKKKKVFSFVCSACPSIFSSWNECQLHQKQVHNQGFPCSLCDKSVFDVQSLENHTRVAHGQKEWIICGGCGVSFNQGSHIFNYHIRKEDCIPACRENAVPCPRCKNFKLENDHTLEIHMRIKHEATYNAPYKCDQCTASFHVKKNLRRHLESHGDGAVCPQCGKTYGSEFHLRVHMKDIHGPRQSHSCHLCKRTFMQKDGLRRHLKLHKPENPYVCHICGKRFKVKNYLTIHSWSHDPEKRKTFAERSEKLKKNANRVKRGRRERVEVLPDRILEGNDDDQ